MNVQRHDLLLVIVISAAILSAYFIGRHDVVASFFAGLGGGLFLGWYYINRILGSKNAQNPDSKR